MGAALLAWEKDEILQAGTRFRGWNLEDVDYQIREFTCKGCENRCDMQEFRVEGEKTVEVPGSGGTSAEPTEIEYLMGIGWLDNILREMST